MLTTKFRRVSLPKFIGTVEHTAQMANVISTAKINKGLPSLHSWT